MKIFITDGSAVSFFTAVFTAFREECIITSDKNVQLSFDSATVNVLPDYEKSDRVRRAIARYDSLAETDILLALRSSCNTKEQIAFNYIRKLMELKSPINKRLSLPEVIALNETVYKVNGETHRMKGFLRFMESANGILYAPYSPDNDITDLLMPHFCARFSAQKFIIHDLKRKVAGIYDGNEWIICEAGETEICLSENEKLFENLWKKYYKSVNITERPHERQMRGYMPARYWKYMPEKYDI